MNEILIVVIIGILALPVSILLLRAIFGKSIMFTVSLWTVYLSIFGDVLFFIIGKLGIMHTLWGVPLAFAVGILIYVAINKALKRPLQISINQVKSLADGNLGKDISSYKADNELGVLNKSIIDLQQNLTNIITRIKENADFLVDASHELNSSSEQISHGAIEQASSVEEVSSTMEELASNTILNAENAQQTESIVLNISGSVQKLGNASRESLKSVHDIAGKISIITEIAFQTNILALNAAVEAARAGETGKGFGVVASEVRKLAERSKIAADEIVNLADKSVRLTEESGKLMTDLIPEIEKSTHLVHSISVSSLEQKNGINQVNESIQQLNMVTQQNASSSENMAVRSEKLAEQSGKLHQLISYFKVMKSK